MTSDGLLFAEADAEEDWDGIASEAKVDENALYLELDGWEGPLDLLLDLARRQKGDLRSISILSLVDQYLDYIEQAGALKLELAELDASGGGGRSATLVTALVWPSRVWMILPVPRSHSLTVLSDDELTNRVPSGLKASPAT